MNRKDCQFTHQLCLYALTLVTALVLAGCAGQSKPVDNTRQKMDAARALLAEAAYVSAIFSECEKLGADVELEALSVQQDWLIKNWTLIAAADDYYSEKEKASGVLYDGELLSLAAIKLAYDAEQRAKNELNFSQRSPINQQKVCMNRLNLLTKNEMDLSKKVNGKSAPFIVSETPVTGNMSTGRVPGMAGTIIPGSVPGRTHYLLTEQLKQECPQTELLVLRNEWPNETYAVYCAGKPLTLMVCEWGKCERRAN